MKNLVPYELDGKHCQLYFSLSALFEIKESFGGLSAMQEAVADQDRMAEAVPRILAILARQGQLFLNESGQDADAPDLRWFALHMGISDLSDAIQAITNAIHGGATTEHEDDTPVDVTLEEIEGNAESAAR